jgi:PAS domain S-box-containing protein
MGTGCSNSPDHPGAGRREKQPALASGAVTAEVSSQQRLEALMRSSPLAVMEWDADYHVVNWTGAASSMFGWEASEVLGKRLEEWRFVYEEDWVLVRVAMAAMSNGKSYVGRNRNYRKDGSVVYCEWHNSVLVDQSGVFQRGLSLALDVTERWRVQEALQASEEKYRQIVETAPIGIFRSTVAGRLLSVNSRLAILFGFRSPEEMIASVLDISRQMYVHPEQRSEIVGRATACREFVSAEVEFCRPDGSTFPCNFYLRATGDCSGGVAYLEGFVEDITERRRAEEQLRESHDALERRVLERTAELSAANERLKELDRLKSQFLASMSHELRTPLNSIIGFTSLLRKGLTGPVNAEQTKQLEIVQTSASHLLALINDLLDVSRIEAGRADLEREPFDFVGVLNEVMRLLEPMANRKALEVIAEAPAPAIPMKGDRKRTLQVLLNLANNAVKFTENGRVTIRVTVEQDTLRVAVADTGIGVRPEHLGMLFEAFRQLDGSAKRVYEGTGLGLHLCRKLLDLMGGEIRVESVFGKGSCFTFAMPLELAAESPAAPQE